MDNSDNEEDLKELEIRLYSQVHHEAANTELAAETKETGNVESGELESTENNQQSGNSSGRIHRYWDVTEKTIVSQHRKFVPNAPQSGGDVQELCASSPQTATAGVGSEKPAINESIEKEQDSGPGATLSASGGGPEKKRSINPFSAKPARKASAHTKGSEKKPGDAKGGFLDRKMRKIEQTKKIMQKREKSKNVRLKKKKSTETIVLDSSDDEDVVLIPVPPPPIVNLDSSDEESFVKPSDPKPGNDARVGASNSRCNSPNSVMSDDFIGQQDKKRLLNETVLTEEELQCEAGVKDMNEETVEQCEELSKTEKFATPTKRVSKSKAQEEPTYEVTQSNFRAVDVYESESSDMPESIYSKGKRKRQSVSRKTSESEAELGDSVTKTKRLRKRKASGSCKGSEPNDDSSDSEIVNNSATSLPYIARGEAVVSCKQKIKKRQTSNREGINAEDQEFMDKLSDIARGSDSKSTKSDEDLESNHSVEDITARDIVEDVLKRSGQIEKAAECEKAIPSEAIVDLDLLNVIDSICTKIDDYEEPPRHGVVRAEMPEAVDEPSSEPKMDDSDACVIIEDKTKKLESPSIVEKVQNTLNFMKVVFTNRDHVLWNEEMVRFYELSWGQERFNVDQMLRVMDRNANWRILNTDRFLRGKKFVNLKCNNCCEWGHRLVDCPMPRKDIVCFICGDIGHKEPRCPNTICLRCGRKTNVYTRTCQNCISENHTICPICKIRGHNLDSCPDKWRRYHSTTTINEHLNSVVHYNKVKHCCICAGRGHLPENCRSSNKMNEYHAPTTEIRYHSKSYDDVDVKEPLAPGVIGVQLMSEPDPNVSFPSLKQVTKDQYYGRFLAAVGLFDAPESKIVRNFVLNPFAKDSGLVDKKTITKSGKRKLNSTVEDIQLNISGIVEIDDETGSDLIADVSEESDKMRTTGSIETRNSKSNKASAVDDDSNYSFSEHFPDNEKPEEESTSVIKINRKKSVGPLPDFIPLFDDSIQEATGSKRKKIGPLPDFISLNDSDDEESKKNKEDTETAGPCEGKIYLSKFHSQYLLSPAGTTYLIAASKRHNIKVSMDWTAVGNVLVIEGRLDDQDQFHAELMEKMKVQSEEKNRNNLEQSQKLPRSREVLIKFLQESILNLEKDLGNVHDLYKKMKYNESNYGKTSFKSAEKSRRSLNMILMGQGGLREGPMHLSILQDNIRELQTDMKNEQVPEEYREEVEKHYRYIFSSFKHNNYDQLIRQYTTLKKLNQLPKLGLDYKLLGKKSLDTKFTKDQKERLQLSADTQLENNFADISDANEFKAPRTEFGVKPQRNSENANRGQQPPQWSQQRLQQQQLPQTVPPAPPAFLHTAPPAPGAFLRTTPPPPPTCLRSPQKNNSIYQKPFQSSPNQRQQSFQGSNFNAGGNSKRGSYVPNKVREAYKKWDARVANCNKIPTPPKIDTKQDRNSSSYWSRESVKFIARCMAIRGLQSSILERLGKLSERASKNLLSFSDFKSIKKIYYNLLKAEKGGT